MDWMNALRCPRCKSSNLSFDTKLNDGLPERGEAICHRCGAHYPISDHILDLTQPNDSHLLTLAGLSNYLPFLPWGYENVWRPRSLTLLSGVKFPIERELKLLNDWMQIQPRELIIDLGSSTDCYARGIGKQNSQATIVAVDMASGMLRAGRKYAQRDSVKNIAHVRSPAQRLPFADATIDVIVCGGSLNEFRSMHEVLVEARRVCKPNGRMFAMCLLKATSLAGRIGQWNANLSGISFTTLDELNSLIDATGWTCERQHVFGVVVFTLMKPRREG